MKLLGHKEIRPPTISCHAASLLYHRGDRILAWFGGTAEGSCDTQIYIQVNDLEPNKLLYSQDYEDYNLIYQLPFWNPVLCTFNKELLIFFKQGKFCDSWTTFAARLKIDKRTIPVEIKRMVMLQAGQCGPAKNRPIADPADEDVLLCGASYETNYSWCSAIEEFDPLRMEIGLSRNRLTVDRNCGKKGLIQPALFKRRNGGVGMVLRSDAGTVFASNWPEGKLVDTGIPNPNSSLDVLTHSNGRMYMAYNPRPYDRLPLVLQEIEEDEINIIRLVGAPMPIETKLEDVPGISLLKNMAVVYPHGIIPRIIGLTPEASYPSLCETPEGKIECAYTYGRRIIKIATIEV
jgi:predicted neuraminidase